MEFADMVKVLLTDPNSIFEWQGIKIMSDSEGNIIDELGEVLKLDKYTVSYTYQRIK
jgi:hypothetical protein